LWSVTRRPGAGNQPRAQAVAVGGRRVKTIDVPAHCIFPKAAALMGMTRDKIYPVRLARVK
jgi:hypothetical protein